MSTIITTTDLNNFTGKTLDTAKAAQVVAAVNQWIESHTNRCWGTTKTVDERYDWAKRIWLRHQDVTAINSIKLGLPGQVQSTLGPTSYFFNPFGRVTLMAGLIGNRAASTHSLFYNDYLEINYTYGVATVPDDLKTAALAIAGILYNHAASNLQTVVAESVGSYRMETAAAVRGTSQGPNPATNSTELYYQIVDSYKTRRQ